MIGATVVIALDHGPALRALGGSRRAFVRDVLGLFRPMAAQVFLAAGPAPAARQGLTATASGSRPGRTGR